MKGNHDNTFTCGFVDPDIRVSFNHLRSYFSFVYAFSTHFGCVKTFNKFHLSNRLQIEIERFFSSSCWQSGDWDSWDLGLDFP